MINLSANQRAAGSSKEQQHFRQLQNNARGGNSTTDDWKCLLTRARSSLSEIDTFLSSAVKLCFGNKKIAKDNYNSLINLGQPVAVINAKHSNTAAEKLPADDMGGFQPRLLLSKDSKVMLIRNLWTEAGLSNGTMGTVQAIICKHGDSPHALPIAVVVMFK